MSYVSMTSASCVKLIVGEYSLNGQMKPVCFDFDDTTIIDSDGVHIKNLIMRSINDLEGVFDQTKDYILDKCKNDSNYVVRMVYEQEMEKIKESIA